MEAIPVTMQLVVTCFAVCTVVLGVFGYMVQRFQTFQTKEDAAKVEGDLKEWIRRIEDEVAGVQKSLEGIGKDVSYIRGRLEPNK